MKKPNTVHTNLDWDLHGSPGDNALVVLAGVISCLCHFTSKTQSIQRVHLFAVLRWPNQSMGMTEICLCEMTHRRRRANLLALSEWQARIARAAGRAKAVVTAVVCGRPAPNTRSIRRGR